MLWGEDLDGRSGLLRSLTSGRTILKFNSDTNRFGASDHLKEASELLSTNAQSDSNRKLIRNAIKWSIVMDGIDAINEAFFKGRG